jgi:hypothetical protein
MVQWKLSRDDDKKSSGADKVLPVSKNGKGALWRRKVRGLESACYWLVGSKTEKQKFVGEEKTSSDGRMSRFGLRIGPQYRVPKYCLYIQCATG